jgi:hypothetical protein
MARYQLVVLTNAAKGKDAEFNAWYDNTHVKDVLEIPGFLAAQRYKLAPGSGQTNWSYLALYEIETDDPAKTMADMQAHAASGKMAASDAADLSTATVFFASTLGPKVMATNK